MSSENWREALRRAVELFGHRNWIVVADAAYPVHVSEGVETILADADPVEVLRSVLEYVASAPHVRATAHLDAELEALTEQCAPGVAEFRAQLGTLLQPFERVSMPHQEMLARLDDAGRKFRVLVLKTRLYIPYTSVFLHLSCSYWTDAAETELRASMHVLR